MRNQGSGFESTFQRYKITSVLVTLQDTMLVLVNYTFGQITLAAAALIAAAYLTYVRAFKR